MHGNISYLRGIVSSHARYFLKAVVLQYLLTVGGHAITEIDLLVLVSVVGMLCHIIRNNKDS
jgi:hypothetical protein